MIRTRIDKTHVELIKVLRSFGWMVLDTHGLKGFVDAVGYHHRHGVVLFEFKASEKSPLTKGQTKLIEMGWPVVVLWSFEQVAQLTLTRTT